MTQAVATKTNIDFSAIEKVLIGGDLAPLSAPQRVDYYNRVCDLIGLNPTTKPFDYLSLSGKLVLYANKGCAEQLRQVHKISLKIVARERIDDIYVVTAEAQDATGRTDAATGAVPIAGLKGEALANALMKAETKAKRRVTLSICGLNMLDDTEVDSIPGAARGAGSDKAQALQDKVTKNVTGPGPVFPAGKPEVLPPETREPGSDEDTEPTPKEIRDAVKMVEKEFGLTPPPEDHGAYVCQFGKKYKDKAIKDFPLDELQGFVNWLGDQEKAKPLSQLAATFREHAVEYLGSLQT